VVYGREMAVSDSREVVIEATPEEILDVIADVESTPEWSSQQQAVEIVESGEDGRPRRVKMKVKTAGISDEQVVDYTWTDDGASWTLVSAGQLRSQDASYALTPEGDKTKVKFELTVDPSVPRSTLVPANGVEQAAPAPRFSRTPSGPIGAPPKGTTPIDEIGW
jgi:hypothetical protein